MSTSSRFCLLLSLLSLLLLFTGGDAAIRSLRRSLKAPSFIEERSRGRAKVAENCPEVDVDKNFVGRWLYEPFRRAYNCRAHWKVESSTLYFERMQILLPFFMHRAFVKKVQECTGTPTGFHALVVVKLIKPGDKTASEALLLEKYDSLEIKPVSEARRQGFEKIGTFMYQPDQRPTLKELIDNATTWAKKYLMGFVQNALIRLFTLNRVNQERWFARSYTLACNNCQFMANSLLIGSANLIVNYTSPDFEDLRQLYSIQVGTDRDNITAILERMQHKSGPMLSWANGLLYGLGNIGSWFEAHFKAKDKVKEYEELAAGKDVEILFSEEDGNFFCPSHAGVEFPPGASDDDARPILSKVQQALMTSGIAGCSVETIPPHELLFWKPNPEPSTEDLKALLVRIPSDELHFSFDKVQKLRDDIRSFTEGRILCFIDIYSTVPKEVGLAEPMSHDQNSGASSETELLELQQRRHPFYHFERAKSRYGSSQGFPYRARFARRGVTDQTKANLDTLKNDLDKLRRSLGEAKSAQKKRTSAAVKKTVEEVIPPTTKSPPTATTTRAAVTVLADGAAAPQIAKAGALAPSAAQVAPGIPSTGYSQLSLTVDNLKPLTGGAPTMFFPASVEFSNPYAPFQPLDVPEQISTSWGTMGGFYYDRETKQPYAVSAAHTWRAGLTACIVDKKKNVRVCKRRVGLAESSSTNDLRLVPVDSVPVVMERHYT